MTEHRDSLEQEYREKSYYIITFSDDSAIIDGDTFVQISESAIPYNPEISPDISPKTMRYAAFKDSFMEAIHDLCDDEGKGDNYLILWTIDTILKNAPEHLAKILDCVNANFHHLERRGYPLSEWGPHCPEFKLGPMDCQLFIFVKNSHNYEKAVELFKTVDFERFSRRYL